MKTETNSKEERMKGGIERTMKNKKLKLIGMMAGVASLIAGISYLGRPSEPQLVYTANNPILRGGGKDGASRVYNFGPEGLEAVVETNQFVRKNPDARTSAEVFTQNGQPIVYWSGSMHENDLALDGYSWEKDLPLSPPQKTAMGLYILRHTNSNGEYIPHFKVN